MLIYGSGRQSIYVALLPIVYYSVRVLQTLLTTLSLIFIPLIVVLHLHHKLFSSTFHFFWDSALCFPKDSLYRFNVFAVPGVKGSGVKGVVYTAEPLNACSPLTNKAVKGPPSPFALVIGGGCTFDEKVKNAQDAGFKAAIVYDHENGTGVPVSSNVPCPSHYFLIFPFLIVTRPCPCPVHTR